MKETLSRRQFGRPQPLTQRGDTIVEVLIAIVLISMILGGAYVTARSSQINIRRAQERGEALKIAESQTEDLRDNPPGATPADPFCYAQNGGANTPFSVGFSLPPAAGTTTPAGYPAACVVDTNGQTSGTGLYHVAIVYDTLNTDYVVHIRWVQVGGGDNGEVTLAYRP